MQQLTGPCHGIHAFTHVGQREENQDRLTVLHSPDGDATLLVVADGLGGHRGGALAAQAVVDAAAMHWDTYSVEKDAAEFLLELVRESEAAVHRLRDEHNRALYDVPTGQPVSGTPIDPHSTLAALLIRGDEATSIHAGDSRVMQFSDHELVERTLDHSVAQLHVLRGLISEEEMADHPDQKVVFSQIGGGDSPETEVKHWDLAKGRRFVLCSDGFWEIFQPGEMLELFSSPDPDSELAQRFDRKLESLEKHDNTTAVLAELEQAGGAFSVNPALGGPAGKGPATPTGTGKESTMVAARGEKERVALLSGLVTRHPAIFGLGLLVLAIAVLLWSEQDGNDQMAHSTTETNERVAAPRETPPAPLEDRGKAPVAEAESHIEEKAEGRTTETGTGTPEEAEPAADAPQSSDADENPASSPDESSTSVSTNVEVGVIVDHPSTETDLESAPDASRASHALPATDTPEERAGETGQFLAEKGTGSEGNAAPTAGGATPEPATEPDAKNPSTSSIDVDGDTASEHSAAGAERPTTSEPNFNGGEATATPDEETAGDTAESTERPPTRPVPLESTNLELEVPLETGSVPTKAAEEELRQRGRLGDEDVLQPSGNQEVGDSVISRAQQHHQDIPVYGAEVRVVVRDGQIVSIRGQPAPDVNLATTTPENDYPATIALAETLVEHDITPEDEGLLVIFATGTAYRLAWRGIVVIDGLQEEAVFDAETGEVLLRVPLVHDSEDSSAGDSR